MTHPIKRKRVSRALMLLGLSSGLWAASGHEGASFLDIPVGARPAAMGAAYSALADDAYAPVFNPAGLGLNKGNQLAAQHLSYLESVRYEQISYAHRFKSTQGIGLNVSYLGTGDIQGRDIRGDPISSYSSYYAAYTLAYGRAFDRVAFGVGAKAIQAKISDVRGSAFALDAGSLWHVSDQISLAAVLANAGTPMKFLDQNDPLPMAIRVSAAYRPTSYFLTSAEAAWRRFGDPSAHLGLEFRPLAMLALRLGYRTDTLDELGALAGFNAGFGIEAWGQELAYAWAPYGDLGSAQYVSLVLRFGAAREARRNLVQIEDIKRIKKAYSNSDEDEHMQLMELLSDKEKAAIGQGPKPSAGAER